ncbi:hypothetical protein GCM10012289_09170 [Nonomuraea cavernae]|uniref:Uncharacterized protein n=1 Tax=Nonomuraea cavernae TaxID=2045107 RepID=A0A918DFJ3_9ACTN|nr:hypothetical protein GCM10012289_09170 [Nonomuraea cavernae]
MVLAAWVAITVLVWIMAYVWPLLGHLLVPLGATSMAFAVLVVGEGVAQEVRLTIRMRRYERQREAFLAHRKRFERKDGE